MEWAQFAGVSEALPEITLETGLAGWGGRTRTSEWRNQKSPERFDLTKLFSQLMVKARMSHQRVMSNFPTAPVGGVRRNQAMTENALPSPAAVRMRLHRDRRRKSFAV
jgi:hypothetical protein